MSELLTVANTIVPVITTAAAGFAGAVYQSAQNQVAESVLQRGRELVGRVLERRSDDPQDAEPTEAVERIRGLSEEDRHILGTAVGKWLEEGNDGPAALHAAIEREAAHRRSGKAAGSITVNVHGEGSAGFGYVHNLGGLHLGGRPRGETAGEPGTRR